MRKKPSEFLILVFVFGLSGRIFAEDAPPAAATPVLAIEALGGNPAAIPGWQPALGQGVSAMLTESLESSDHKFQVLETAEATGLQNQTKPDTASSAGGEMKAARRGTAGSPMPATSDAAGSAKPDTGGPAASDFTFGGEVAQFAVDSNGGQVGQIVSSSPLAGLGVNIISAHVQIVWRIEDTATKRIIKRGTAGGSGSGAEFDMASVAGVEGTNSAVATAAAQANTATAGKNSSRFHSLFSGLTKAFDSAGSGSSTKGGGGNAAQSKTVLAKIGGDSTQNPGGTISYDNPVFMNSALGKAAAAAITNLMQQLDALNLPESARAAGLQAATVALKHTRGKVLAVAGKDTIIVSLGSKEGFKAGDLLELYQLTDVKDDKGNVVFTDEKPVGEITLSEVQEEHSRGSYAGDIQVQQGWTVKAK